MTEIELQEEEIATIRKRDISLDGEKDILGVWIGEHESAKFWAGVLNDLKSRCVQQAPLSCWSAPDCATWPALSGATRST